jgi:hypothetical protein
MRAEKKRHDFEPQGIGGKKRGEVNGQANDNFLLVSLRSSKVLPGLPLMSPDFSAAEIAPLLSSDFAAGDSFLFSNTATAMHPLLAVPRVLLVSNAFMLKSIWFSVFIY